MSYIEHGPRIFLAGRPGSGAPLTYGDYVLPRRRTEGRLKLYDSCTDIRAWSPNPLESTRYFRELNEHAPALGKVVPFDVIMESMIGLTAQAQNELRVARRELQKYKSLKLTPEQRKYLEGFEKEANVGTRMSGEIKIEPITRPLCREKSFDACRLASLQRSDTYLSVYLRPDGRFRCDKGIRALLTDTRVPREKRNANSLSRNNTTYLVSRVTSCNLLTEAKATQECSNQTSICVEYVDASSQAEQDVREVGVQADECKDDYDKRPINTDESSSQYYENSESVSTSESELGVNSDPAVCEKNHKRVIIEKDSEIIVLKNELGMKEDELEELRELKRHLQMLLKEKDDNANILKRNFNALQDKLKMVSDKRNDEVEDLCAKLASSEYLMDQLKTELVRKCQVCHLQSQDIQKLRKQAKEAEVLFIENDSLTRKVKEIEYLSKEAESCGIALEQVKNVWRERDMLQKQYCEQSRTLAYREDEIKRLSTLIKQMHCTADTREVEMNRVVADLRNEIQAKTDKIAQCETQLVCMEREVNNLTSMLKSSLNKLDESKIAYEGICEYAKCEHDTCLDVQSALAALRAFIAELEECKLERRSRLREIDNLKACMACYSQESVSEITNTVFDIGHESIQLTAGDISTSSNYDDRHSSKEPVSVQVQSDEVETTTEECSEESEKARLNEVISYEEIDRALATHIKRSIDKIHEISAILQGAGDQHAQIVKEHAKQQQELQMKDLEITELKQKVAEQMLRRGEGDCAIQEQLRKKMLEKEKVLENVISQRDSEIGRLREHLDASENRIAAYRAQCDTLRNENADLVDTRSALSKENEARCEELRAQRDQMRELLRQTDDLKLTVVALKEETSNIDVMRKKLIELQVKNNDLTNQLLQTNEIISKNNEAIADLRCKDEQNRMALTDGSIRYDAMITQKHSEIVKLQDENQSLRDQLRETEIKLARTSDVISSLRQEGDDGTVAINPPQTEDSSALDKDEERPEMWRVDSLRTEVAASSCEDLAAMNVESELEELCSREENERTREDAETARNDDQLSHGDATIKRPLKDALCTLSGKIYEKIARLRGESRERETENVRDAEQKSKIKDVAPENENERLKQRTKEYADKSCQQDDEFYTGQRARDESDSIGQASSDCNAESAARNLRFLERQHEEKLREIKSLADDVKLRDYEIKNLQECITYLLQEKNDLQNKVQCQVEEYQNKLTLLKKKYDSSLNALRKRHNENIERLQARFEDIMRSERSPFDAEGWLQSLNSKELTELHNRINILSTHATANRESDMRAEATRDRDDNGGGGGGGGGRRDGNPEGRGGQTRGRRFAASRKERARESGASLGGEAHEGPESPAKIFDADDGERVAVTELYSRDLRLKQKHRPLDGDGEKLRSVHAKASVSRTSGILDRQREKFIYQCSIHHRLNNAR